MKLHLYDECQLNIFPLYAATCDINHTQVRVTRQSGYEQHQLFLITRGSGILKILDETYIVNENDMFYLAAGTPHEYYPTDTAFSTSFVGFFGNWFPTLQSYYSLGNYGVYKNKSIGSFKASAKKLYEIMDTSCELSTLCSLTFAAVTDFFNEAQKKKTTPVENVKMYIENNYSKMITLDDILTVYPYSKTKLCHDFKSAFGISIFDMITNIRLRHAEHILINTPQKKLSEVAAACGFNDVSYFCKMYKKLYGHSPKKNITSEV